MASWQFQTLAKTLLTREVDLERGREFNRRYWNDPAAWARDCIEWKTDSLSPYQAECIAQVGANHRVAVRGPHALGKSCVAALTVLWFATTRDGIIDWKAGTTASTWRQLTRFLWPEIHKWARRIRWSVIGRDPFTRNELLLENLKLKTGEAFALASDRPENLEGAHASEMLYLVDEAKTVPPEVWDAIEGAFAYGDVYALAISTPGPIRTRFYDIHARKPGYEDWWVRHVTLQEAIDAGRISPAWVEARKRQWGEQSPVYQNRVLGEFAASEEEGVIPLAWLELAIDRFQNLKESNALPTELTCVGVDVARFGEDFTTIATRSGNAIIHLTQSGKEDTMETTGRVVQALENGAGYAVVDVIGVGAGVVDRLRELKFKAYPFNAGESPTEKDMSGEVSFLNKRAQAWWHLRELLDPANGHELALPGEDELIGDLTAPQYKMTSSGKLQIESKDDVKKRIGRSTNVGDAVVQAFFPVKRRVLVQMGDETYQENPWRQ